LSKIVVSRRHCQIIEEDDFEFLNDLRRHLSFFIQGAEHSKKYLGYIDSKTGKQITWDGHKRLISETLQFAPGLLDRVQRFYALKQKPLEFICALTPPGPAVPKDILNKLNTINKNPYPYQIQAAKVAIEKSHGVLRMATGSGKTIVAALIVSLLGKSSIVYVIGKDLLYQIHELFSNVFDEPIGIIGDGKCEIADINIATIWTVGQALGLRVAKAEDEEDENVLAVEKYKEIRNVIGKTQVHLFDECHLAACDTIQGICQKLNPENIYGMSASPWRDDGADLLIENYLGNVIVNLSARELINSGYLVAPLIKFLAVPQYERKKGVYQKIYRDYVVENEERNSMIVRGAAKLVEQGYQTLVLFHSLAHGKKLYRLLNRQFSCALLSGQDDSETRIKIKKNLEAGKIDCVIASKIFDIGIDLPSISGLIIAGGGKSSVRALQRIGRVIRKHPGKTNSAVIDFADQAPYLMEHSQIRRKIYSEEFEVRWPGEKISN